MKMKAEQGERLGGRPPYPPKCPATHPGSFYTVPGMLYCPPPPQPVPAFAGLPFGSFRSTDRTLLQKLRDAIHEIVGKLTGRAKRQAQTVEGKLQAAFEAASQQAESLQNRQTNGTINDWRSSYR